MNGHKHFIKLTHYGRVMELSSCLGILTLELFQTTTNGSYWEEEFGRKCSNNVVVKTLVEQFNHEGIDGVLYELPNSTYTKPFNYNSTECLFLLVRDKWITEMKDMFVLLVEAIHK